MSYTKPGVAFLQTNKVEDFEDVRRYLAFLHKSAGTDQNRIPVDLNPILETFGLKKAAKDLFGAKGMFEPEFGIVFIDPSDSKFRQRFGTAHELVEALFAPLKRADLANLAKYGNYLKSTKETLCNRAAAELLMPLDEFLPDLESLGLSFDTARFISRKYQVSFTSALVHQVQNCDLRCGIIFWELRNKPSDRKIESSHQQISYVENNFRSLPYKKLRIRWGIGSPNTPFIPKDKSIPETSSVFEAWKTGASNKCEELLHLSDAIKGKAALENYAFLVEGETKVITLFKFPKNDSNDEQITLF